MASASAANSVQVAVIGAGAIGLAIARTLAQAGKEVLILERAEAIGTETSARNSEVIHAGLYYPSSSWKAKFCVRGKYLLYEYCQSRHISHNRCGKLVVAAQERQLQVDLANLKEQAERNGVGDVRLLSRADMKALEPEVECVGALWSPSTGVLDSHALMLNMLGDAEAQGSMLALKSNVQGGTATPDGIQLRMDEMELLCGTVVNSAGLWADQVAHSIRMPSDSPAWKPPHQYFAKGTYFHLEGVRSPFKHLVYPLPDRTGGLGVHMTMDWSAQRVKFGPDVEWLDPPTRPDEIDLTPDASRVDAFYDSIRKYWPALPDDSLVPDYVGIRPKLQHPLTRRAGSPRFVDFRVDSMQEHGAPGLVHLFGMESPGLTSCMAVAEHVANLVMDS